MSEKRVQPFVPGDLVVVDNQNGVFSHNRILLIIEADNSEDYFQVMLCHEDIDMGSIVDVIVSSTENSMSYDLAVETDLCSVIWRSQVSKKIGLISSPLLEKILIHASNPDEQAGELNTGYYIRGILDPRWRFKEEEGKIFRALCADCVSAKLGSKAKNEATLDVDIFKENICDEREIYQLLQLIKEQKIMLSSEDRRSIIALGVNKRQFWSMRFPDGGFADALHRVACDVLGILISIENKIEDSAIVEVITDGRTKAASPLRNSGIPIITSPKLWIDFESTLNSSPKNRQLITV